MTTPAAGPLPLRIKLGNGIGSVAYGVKDNGFSVLLLIFYNQVLGLEAGAVGLILLAALFLDAIVDPLVGFFGDRTYTRWGKRHPWMYAAILPMAFSWAMLWYPPEGAGTGLYAYLLLFAFLMRASVSCYEVPGLAVVPALTADYDERTSITRWRFLFGWAGGLLMLILAFGIFLVPEPAYPIGQLNLNGYHRYGLAGAGLIIFATLVSSLTTHRRLARLPDQMPKHLPLRTVARQIRQTLSNQAFLILLASTLFAFANQGLVFSATTYMLTYAWQVPQSAFLVYSATLFIGIVGAFLLVGFVLPEACR
jgi:glycoside/pentoside/hexuronide:cation symporter, GPH family